MKSVKEAADAYAINKHPVVIGRRSATSENFIAGHDHAISELEDITNRYNALSLANAELEELRAYKDNQKEADSDTVALYQQFKKEHFELVAASKRIIEIEATVTRLQRENAQMTARFHNDLMREPIDQKESAK